MIIGMSITCPECGAKLDAYTSCQEIFDQFLALEFSDPEYGAVHFLTVACFMIQHYQYSESALTWIKQTLGAHLSNNMTADQLRKLAYIDSSNTDRDWKVLRQKDDPQPVHLEWSVTIADVAGNFTDAAGYREWINRWAQATLAQM